VAPFVEKPDPGAAFLTPPATSMQIGIAHVSAAQRANRSIQRMRGGRSAGAEIAEFGELIAGIAPRGTAERPGLEQKCGAQGLLDLSCGWHEGSRTATSRRTASMAASTMPR